MYLRRTGGCQVVLGSSDASVLPAHHGRIRNAFFSFASHDYVNRSARNCKATGLKKVVHRAFHAGPQGRWFTPTEVLMWKQRFAGNVLRWISTALCCGLLSCSSRLLWSTCRPICVCCARVNTRSMDASTLV